MHLGRTITRFTKQRWTTLTAVDDFMTANNTLARRRLHLFTVGIDQVSQCAQQAACVTDTSGGVRFQQAQQPMKSIVPGSCESTPELACTLAP